MYNKQLVVSGFVVSRIIKVSVSVISLGLRFGWWEVSYSPKPRSQVWILIYRNWPTSSLSIPPGHLSAFVIFSWNGCKCPTVGPGGSYKTPTGGAEKKVNFFSAKFSITVKCWKKGATLTASRRIDKCPTSRSVGRRNCCLTEIRSPSQQSHNGRDVAWLQHRSGGRRTNPYDYKQPK